MDVVAMFEDLEHAVDGRGPAELLGTGAGGSSSIGTRELEHPRQLRRQSVCGVVETPATFGRHDIGECGRFRHHHRRAGSQRLQCGKSEGLVRTRSHCCVRRSQESREFDTSVDESEKFDRQSTCSTFESGPSRSVPRDHEPHIDP